MLVGNKTDLSHKFFKLSKYFNKKRREVSYDEGEEFGRSY